MSQCLPPWTTFPVHRVFEGLVGRIANHSFFSRNFRYSTNRSSAYSSSAARSVHPGSFGDATVAHWRK